MGDHYEETPDDAAVLTAVHASGADSRNRDVGFHVALIGCSSHGRLDRPRELPD